MSACPISKETSRNKWKECRDERCRTNKTCNPKEWFSCSNPNSCAPASSCQLPTNTSATFYEIFSSILRFLGNNKNCNNNDKTYDLLMGDYDNDCDNCLPRRLKIDKNNIDCLTLRTYLLSEHVQISAKCEVADCPCDCRNRIFCNFRLKAIPPTTVTKIVTTTQTTAETSQPTTETSEPTSGISHSTIDALQPNKATSQPHTSLISDVTTLTSNESLLTSRQTDKTTTQVPSTDAMGVLGGGTFPTSALAGGLVGGGAALLILFLLVFILIRLRNRAQQNKRGGNVHFNATNGSQRQVLTPYTSLVTENGPNSMSNQTYDNLHMSQQPMEMTNAQYDYVGVFPSATSHGFHAATNNGYIDIGEYADKNNTKLKGDNLSVQKGSTGNDTSGIHDYITILPDPPVENNVGAEPFQCTRDSAENENYFILEPEDTQINTSFSKQNEFGKFKAQSENKENDYNVLDEKMKGDDIDQGFYHHVRHVNLKPSDKEGDVDYDELRKPFDRKVVEVLDDDYDHCPHKTSK